MEKFSSRLHRWRSRNGLTQDQAGEYLGVTGKYVGMLEREAKLVEDGNTLDLLLKKLEEKETSGAWADSNRLAETPTAYHVATPARGGLAVSELLDQVRADVEALAGDEPERARAYRFLRDVHLPMLGRALNLES